MHGNEHSSGSFSLGSNFARDLVGVPGAAQPVRERLLASPT